MTRITRESAGELPASEAAPAPLESGELWRLLSRFALGLLLLLVIASALGHWARADAEAIARGFVERYGYPGIALGTFLADGFHFPIPPQFYMLLSIASGQPAAECLAVIGSASLLAGAAGYQLM